MDNPNYWYLAALTAYVWGSIPYGYLIAKANGVDIRTLGSKNIGATNVYRCVGKGPGLLTFALDLCKGFLGTLPFLDMPIGLRVICGFWTVIGHNYTCFLRFKGGKGIASSLGLLIGLAPVAAGVAGLVFVAVFAAFRYISLSSVSAAASLLASTWFIYSDRPKWFSIILCLLGVLAIVKHRANIGRLINGTEPKFSFSRKESK